MALFKTVSESHFEIDGVLHPRIYDTSIDGDKNVLFLNVHTEKWLNDSFNILDIDLDGQIVADFASETEFLNTLKQFCLKKGGGDGLGSQTGYMPAFVITSNDQFVSIDETNEIKIKGSFIDFIDTAAITSLIDDSGVLVSIKSKTFNGMVIEVISNNVFQDYTIELSAKSGQTQSIPIKSANIISPTSRDWSNISSGISVGDGIVQTNSTATGWNKQAVFGSIPSRSDGQLTFVFGGGGLNGTSTTTGMMGLGIDPNTNTSYLTIDHAIYINGGSLRLYENGSSRGSFGIVAAGDTLKIERRLGVILYYKNDALFYTSTVQSTGALYFDCSLYRNIKLSNLKIIY